MIDLFTINARHRKLYSAFLKNEELDSGFQLELRELLEEIKDQSQNVVSIDDYLQLDELVDQWKKAGPALGVDLKIDLSKLFLAPPAPDRMRQTAPDQPMWTENSLSTWVKAKAYEFSKSRAQAWHDSTPVEEILRHYQDSLSPEEREQQSSFDWRLAELHLAADVLHGDFDLRCLESKSYWRLEGKEGQMWLRHIKTLKGYLNWKQRGGGWGAEAARDDYLRACDELNRRLLDSNKKCPQSSFELIRRYFDSEFLDGAGRLDTNKERTRVWMQSKANRLMEIGFPDHMEQSRQAAKDQMAWFYENITRAVMGADPESTKMVLQALGLLPNYEIYEAIANCFEMALGIYFLDAYIVGTFIGHLPGLEQAWSEVRRAS